MNLFPFVFISNCVTFIFTILVKLYQTKPNQTKPNQVNILNLNTNSEYMVCLQFSVLGLVLS